MLNSGTLNGSTLNGPSQAILFIDPAVKTPANDFEYDKAGGQVSFGIEALDFDVEHDVTYLTAELAFNVEHLVTDVYTIIGTETLDFEVTHDVTGTDSISTDADFVVWDPTLYFDFTARRAFVWEVVVNLEVKGGDRPGESGDISTNLTQAVSVEAEENAARIANFVREPRPYGPCPIETDPEFLDLNKHIGRTVTVDYVLKDVDGVILSTTRLFTGFVDEVTFDPVTRLSAYVCSDGRQQLLENMDRASIDAMMPGSRYSDFVFDPEVDNFQYAQDRLATVPYALDLDAEGNWQYTKWAAEPSGLWIYTDANVVYESIGIDIEQFRNITTEVEIDVGYAYRRLRERSSTFLWSYPGSFCNYLDSGHTIPRKQMIVDAANSSGWRLLSITFQNLPKSQAYTCSTGYRVWVNTGNGLGPLFTQDVSGTIARRFVSGVRESYALRILAPDSATQFGIVTDTLSLSVSPNFQEEGWTEGSDARIEEALIERNVNISTTTQVVPPADFGYDFQVNGTDKYYDAIGDEITDGEGRRVDFDNAIETIIEQGKTLIRQAHRNNSVNWQSILNPDIDLSQTLEIDLCPVHARGKVQFFTHTMDLNSGEAVTDITVAVSKTAGGVVSETPTEPPPIPDTITGMGNGVGIGSMGSRYGGQLAGSLFNYSYPSATSPEIDPSEPFNGYSGNRIPSDVGSNIYPEQFQIVTEEIEGGDREELEGTESKDYFVDIPDELLNLQA